MQRTKILEQLSRYTKETDSIRNTLEEHLRSIDRTLFTLMFGVVSFIVTLYSFLKIPFSIYILNSFIILIACFLAIVLENIIHSVNLQESIDAKEKLYLQERGSIVSSSEEKMALNYTRIYLKIFLSKTNRNKSLSASIRFLAYAFFLFAFILIISTVHADITIHLRQEKERIVNSIKDYEYYKVLEIQLSMDKLNCKTALLYQKRLPRSEKERLQERIKEVDVRLSECRKKIEEYESIVNYHSQ